MTRIAESVAARHRRSGRDGCNGPVVTDRPGLRAHARHEDLDALGAEGQAGPGEGLQGRRRSRAGRERSGQRADAEDTGGPVHRGRGEGPDHRSDRLGLGRGDREGSPQGGRQVDRLRPPGRRRRRRPLHVVRRTEGRRAPGQERHSRRSSRTASTARSRLSPRSGAVPRTRTRASSRAASTQRSTRSTRTAR